MYNPPAKEESTETSTTPSLGLLGDGRTKSALIEHRTSVDDPGRCILDDPLDNTSEEDVEVELELLLVLME
jgi:hypothetical protein